MFTILLTILLYVFAAIGLFATIVALAVLALLRVRPYPVPDFPESMRGRPEPAAPRMVPLESLSVVAAPVDPCSHTGDTHWLTGPIATS